MTQKILIAEDMEDSRFYLQTLLEGRGYQVAAAENGKSAIHLFQENDFDLIISDIRMPEMDGLSMLRTIKKSHPQTPVIIISAYRELENVIEALRYGACDYITKPYEEKQVFDSIDRVSRLTDIETIEKNFTGHLRHEFRSFDFETHPDEVNEMAHYLCRNLTLLGLKAEVQSLQVSLIEALTNAVYHGNLELSSTMKKGGDINTFKTYREAALEKLKLAPYKTRKVRVEYSLDQQKVQFVIRDEGPGFDPSKLADPTDPESFLKPSGRGLLMIRTFCDEVNWNKTGNEITLVKFRSIN
jgi:CheY-like chemotaxis protein